MTRNYLQTIHCQHCGNETTTETAFGRWFRKNPLFESKDGHVLYDCDFIRHRFKFDNDRTVQYIMFIEIKTHGAKPDKAQKDTEHIIHQFLNNRKRNKTIQVSEPRPNCVSTLTGKEIKVKAFGYHLLRFQNTNPLDGLSPCVFVPCLQKYQKYFSSASPLLVNVYVPSRVSWHKFVLPCARSCRILSVEQSEMNSNGKRIDYKTDHKRHPHNGINLVLAIL